MLLYVLRHGVTRWNKLKKVQGTMDIPLAPEGIELAEKTGKALRDVPSWGTGRFRLFQISGSRRLTSEFWKELSLKMRRER